MSNTSNYINVSALPILQQISPGDYFIVKTENGEALIDYTDLPFVNISGSNVTFNGTISAIDINVLNVLSSTSAYFDNIYVNGFSGLNTIGAYNYLVINSGVITSATNVPSVFYNSLSATFDAKLVALSSQIPQLFYDGGVVNVDGGANTPVYSEVIRGSVALPDGVFISPSDFNIKILWNDQLEDFISTTSVKLSNIPIAYIEENPSNNYIDSSNKVYFRAMFRPPLLRKARIAWNITKVLNP